MIRFLLAPLMVLPLLFVSLISVVHTHVYDTNAALESFLSALESCDSLCFMGIRPGVTSTIDGFDRLKSHGWTQVTEVYNTIYPFYLYFQATGEVDGVIDSDSLIGLYLKDGIIQSINIPMRVSLGDIWTAKGQADWAFGSGLNSSQGMNHAIGYGETGPIFLFTAPTGVRDRLRRLIDSPITLSLTVEMPPATYQHPSLRGILDGQAQILNNKG